MLVYGRKPLGPIAKKQLHMPTFGEHAAYRNAVERFIVHEQNPSGSMLAVGATCLTEKRLFEQSRPADVRRRIVADVLDTNIFLGRPEQELTVQIAEPDRQEKIDAAYVLGVANAANGWQQYHV